MQTTFETEQKIYTEEEYLAMEEHSPEKHEYFNGKITPMPGASFTHNKITAKLIMAIGVAIEQQQNNCTVCPSDMKIHIPRLRSFVYPDAVVVCGEPEFYENRNDVITNPLLVVEVASPSTAKYDRTGKFRHYKSLPSFREYVIVEQDFPYILVSYKTADKTWTDTEADGMDQSILLQSINCTIDLKRIYNGVEFEKNT